MKKDRLLVVVGITAAAVWAGIFAIAAREGYRTYYKGWSRAPFRKLPDSFDFDRRQRLKNQTHLRVVK